MILRAHHVCEALKAENGSLLRIRRHVLSHDATARDRVATLGQILTLQIISC